MATDMDEEAPVLLLHEAVLLLPHCAVVVALQVVVVVAGGLHSIDNVIIPLSPLSLELSTNLREDKK